MTSTDDKEQPKYEGPVAGGPAHGKRLTASVKTINVPIHEGSKFGVGVYKYEFGMWIWKS